MGLSTSIVAFLYLYSRLLLHFFLMIVVLSIIMITTVLLLAQARTVEKEEGEGGY